MKSIKVLPLAIISTIVGAVLSVILILLLRVPEQASVQATSIDNLYIYFLAFSGIIFGIVTIFLLVAVYRFRARPNDQREGLPIHGITWLEVLWTTIPFLIVVSCGVAGWYVMEKDDVVAEARAGGQVVHITGYQFGWKFDYLNQDINLKEQDQLVLPVNVPVAFELTTNDVMHAFWVPAWRMQMSNTPAQTNQTSITPSKIGTYEVVCAFLCGVGHTGMNSSIEGSIIPKIRVVSDADFKAWVVEQKAAAEQDATTATTTDTGAAA